VVVKIRLPKGFPEKYRDSLVATANLCTVKKHLVVPPAFEILTEAA
jgi:putative redox protein